MIISSGASLPQLKNFSSLGQQSLEMRDSDAFRCEAASTSVGVLVAFVPRSSWVLL